MPELNTTSTADISFMLLIFFLVTTSMDIDKGLTHQLPPPEQKQQVETTVDRHKLMQIVVTADNRIRVDEHEMKAPEVERTIYAWLTQRGADHLITIDTHPQARFETYFSLQNAIVDAYREWRRTTALRMYNKKYELLSTASRNKIRDLCPQHIAEKYNGQEGGGQ